MPDDCNRHTRLAMDLIGRVSNRVELLDLGKCVDNGLVLDRRGFARLFSDSGSLQLVAQLYSVPEPADCRCWVCASSRWRRASGVGTRSPAFQPSITTSRSRELVAGSDPA